jgi:hypothetical protein
MYMYGYKFNCKQYFASQRYIYVQFECLFVYFRSKTCQTALGNLNKITIDVY